MYNNGILVQKSNVNLSYHLMQWNGMGLGGGRYIKNHFKLSVALYDNNILLPESQWEFKIGFCICVGQEGMGI